MVPDMDGRTNLSFSKEIQNDKQDGDHGNTIDAGAGDDRVAATMKWNRPRRRHRLRSLRRCRSRTGRCASRRCRLRTCPRLCGRGHEGRAGAIDRRHGAITAGVIPL
jgi:hypothetical protein